MANNYSGAVGGSANGDAKVLYNFRSEPVEVKLDVKLIQVPANGLVWG